MTGMRAPAFSLVLLLTAGAVACAEPEPAEPPAAEDIEAPAEVATPEPERAELVAVIGELMASVEQARDRLLEATSASRPAAARQAAERALAQLVVDGGRGSSEGHPVFPGVTSEARGGSGEADDALTLALTAANDAGGTLGRDVADALRDPLAGDLGAWQRDPAGQVAFAQRVASGAGDLQEAEQAIFELPGDGTRAIAWAMLAADARSLADAAAYAERGATHLDFVLEALRAALGDAPDDEEPRS